MITIAGLRSHDATVSAARRVDNLKLTLSRNRFKSACYSVFTTRIIINIRKANQQSTAENLAELHDGTPVPPAVMSLALYPSQVHDAGSVLSCQV